MVDVLIIGGGVIGASIARELSRYNADVLVLEKENDVSCGTSKANSGIVHGGFDAKPGSKKAKYNVLGNKMFDDLAKELDFPFKRNGAFVVAFDEESKSVLEELYKKGIANGVDGMAIISGDEARNEEPYLSNEVKYALKIPTSGIVSPYEMTIAYAENAFVNGVKFEFEKEVVSIKKDKNLKVVCQDGSEYEAKVVINAAGVYADVINNMICNEKFNIVARKGEYCLLDKAYGYFTHTTLFQTPTKMGQGILVAPTTHGNILVGPTAKDIEGKENVATTFDGLNEAWNKALLTIPTLNKRGIITQFSGLRAHDDQDDFIIGWGDVEGFYNVSGIESPGLSSAPAIAVEVADDVANKLELTKKDNFVANRAGIPHFSKLSDEEQAKLIKENPLFGHIVCRCEVVTEGEIVSAITRPLGAKDLDGVKRRTRAGMGRCQMGFCTPKVMEIIARELGKDMGDITKKGNGSSVVVGRAK